MKIFTFKSSLLTRLIILVSFLFLTGLSISANAETFFDSQSITKHPLKAPDLSSPRATLMSFISNITEAHRLVLKIHQEQVRSKGFFTPEYIEVQEKEAETFFARAVACLNLSEIPPARRLNEGYESALLLKEILDRISLPDFTAIPDAKLVGEELETKKYPRFLTWKIPNTNLEIGRVDKGPLKGKFLFTPKTVRHLEDYYAAVEGLPYKNNEYITKGFYNFYISTPGRLLPDRWFQYLPQWSNQKLLGQTVWQWGAAVILIGITIFILWLLFLVLSSKKAEISNIRRSWHKIILNLISAGVISSTFYILDSQINLTGDVLDVVGTITSVITYLLISIAIFFAGSTVAETIIASRKITEDGIQASYLRAIFGLLGSILGLIVFVLGLHHIGVSLMPLLTGLGLGGLAIALAARSALANIIGSFMIFIDKPYQVGQRVKIMGHNGTIESIGLRSTKIRLLSGPVAIIPNEKAASAEVENIGLRPYLKRSFSVTITYDTPPEKIRMALEILREILSVPEGASNHPNEAINQPDLPPRVCFNDLNADSLNILVIYWYHPPNYWQYLEHCESINLQIMERFNSEGIDFAFPSVTNYLVSDENRPLKVAIKNNS